MNSGQYSNQDQQLGASGQTKSFIVDLETSYTLDEIYVVMWCSCTNRDAGPCFECFEDYNTKLN
jgi:hypothetical protein